MTVDDDSLESLENGNQNPNSEYLSILEIFYYNWLFAFQTYNFFTIKKKYELKNFKSPTFIQAFSVFYYTTKYYNKIDYDIFVFISIVLLEAICFCVVWLFYIVCLLGLILLILFYGFFIILYLIIIAAIIFVIILIPLIIVLIIVVIALIAGCFLGKKIDRTSKRKKFNFSIKEYIRSVSFNKPYEDYFMVFIILAIVSIPLIILSPLMSIFLIIMVFVDIIDYNITGKKPFIYLILPTC